MNKKAVKTIGLIMFIILISKLLGLVREIFLAGYYGASTEAAAFTTAADIPLKFFDLAFGAAVTSTFIPVFNKYLKSDDTDGGFLFASRFINIIFIMTAILAVLGIIFSEQLIGLFLPGGSPEVLALASQLLKILFPTAVMAGLAFSMVSILQSMGQFTVPAMISLFPNVLTIIYLIFLNKHFGIVGLAVTFVIAWLMQVLIQIPFIRRKNFIYTPSIRFNDPGIKKVSKMVLPILISSWVTPVSLFMLGAFASFMGDESVAAIKYANRLYLILAGIFVFAMMNYLFPLMSRQAEDDDTGPFNETYKRAFESVVFFIIPLAVGAYLLSPNLISIVYERGAFTADDALLTARAFAGFCPAIFGYSLYEITSKAYYARKKVVAPTIMSVLTLAVAFILSYAVVFWTGLDLGYVSLAFSIGITLAAIILVILFNIKTGRILKGRSTAELLRAITGSMMMGTVVILFKTFIINKVVAGLGIEMLLVLAAVLLGLTVYAGMMAVLKSPTFKYYYNWAIEKVRREK